MDKGMTNKQFEAMQQKDCHFMKSIVESKDFDENVKAQILKEIADYYRETSGKETK